MHMSRISANPKVTRLSSGMTQSDFWSRFGVSRSVGSRYESGRELPLPLLLLMKLHNMGKITDQDLLSISDDLANE